MPLTDWILDIMRIIDDEEERFDGGHVRVA